MYLKALIDSDPANAAKTDTQVFDWLKETIGVDRSVLTRSEILQAVDSGEYGLLTGDKLVAFWGLLSVQELNPFGAEADVMQDIFGAGPTITALNTLRVEQVGRWKHPNNQPLLLPNNAAISVLTLKHVTIARA